MVGGRLPAVIPEITDPAFCSAERLEQAYRDHLVRKMLLSEYKWSVVRPVLREYDRQAFSQAAQGDLPALGFSYAAFVPEPSRPPVGLLALDAGPGTWTRYRLWALVRMSGCWPLPVFGGDSLPPVLDACSVCGELQMSVAHVFRDCIAVAGAWRRLCHAAAVPPPTVSRNQFIFELFRDDANLVTRVAHIDFVATAVGPAVRHLELGAEITEYSDLLADGSPFDITADSLRRLERERVFDPYEVPFDLNA